MKKKWWRKVFNKRGEEGYGEMISGFIMLGFFVFLIGKNVGWGPTIFWIIVIFGGLAAIGAALGALGDYIAGFPIRKAQREKRERELQEEKRVREERERKEAERQRQKEEHEKILKERESYDSYKKILIGSKVRDKLADATKIIDNLQNDTDVERRPEIQSFFDKYLPVITASIEASKKGSADIDKTIKTFTEAVKAFSDDLYNVEDVIETNKALLENMAIRDGLYNPYDHEMSPEESLERISE